MPIIFVFAMIIWGMPATSQVNNALLAKKITIASKTIRMDSLLKNFTRQTGAGYSFNARSIRTNKVLSVPAPSLTLSQWLASLHTQTGIDYKVTGNHIMLFDNHMPAHPSQPSPQAAGRKAASKRPAAVQVVIDTVAEHEQPIVDTAVSTRSSTSITVVDTAAASRSAATSSNATPSAFPSQKTTAQPASTATPATNRKSAQPATSASGKQAAQPAAPVNNRSATTTATSSQTRRAAQDAYTPSARAASDDEEPQEYMQFFIGYAKHGSGDYEGISFGGDYTRYLSHRFSLSADLRGSINSGKNEIYSTPRPGETKDNSIRFTTAGAQLGLNAQYSFVRSLHHEFMISLGAFGRYQSASNGSDGYSVYEPIATGLPSPVVEYDNRTPQHTFAVGGLLQLHYHCTLNNNLLLGVRGGLQTDTNGDLIPQAGISVGKRF